MAATVPLFREIVQPGFPPRQIDAVTQRKSWAKAHEGEGSPCFRAAGGVCFVRLLFACGVSDDVALD